MSRRLTVILGCLLTFAAWSAVVPTAAAASTGWSRAHKISDVTMDELASAVDSRGHVFAVGAAGYRHGWLYLLTNESGGWIQSELARAPKRGAINGLAIAVDTDDSIWILYQQWSFWNPCGFGCPPGGPSKFDATYVINNVAGAWSKPVALPARIHADPNSFAVHSGKVHVAWDRRPHGGDREIVYATNANGTWLSYVVGKGWGAHLALDTDGQPWLGYTAPEYAGGVIVAWWSEAEMAFVKSRAPGTSAAIETATLDGFDLDSAGRPVATVDRYEKGNGYWTYWVRLDASGWTAPRRLFNNWGSEFDVDANNRMHVLYDVSETASNDGLYYGSSTGGIADSVRIDRSTRFVEDGPSAADSLAVSSDGRPHVVFANPYNDNRSGTWYLRGPAND